MSNKNTTTVGVTTPVSAALEAFRTGFYGCLTRWGDALFELTDAVRCARAGHLGADVKPGAGVAPQPRQPRQGVGPRPDRHRPPARVTGRHPAGPMADGVRRGRLHLAGCDAETSPQRGFYYSASKHSAGKPIVARWSYQWITQLHWAMDSWSAPLDVIRIPPAGNATDTTITQVRALVERLPTDGDVPVFALDAGYDPIALTDAWPAPARGSWCASAATGSSTATPNHHHQGGPGGPAATVIDSAAPNPPAGPSPTAS